MLVIYWCFSQLADWKITLGKCRDDLYNKTTSIILLIWLKSINVTHSGSFQELPPDALQERKALIRKLQTQLRNEEMSLVLLKKIRQSQVIADQMATAAAVKAAGAANLANSSRDNSGYSQHRGTPPPGSGKGSGSHKSQGSRHTGHQGSPSPAQIKNLMPDLSQLKPVSVVRFLLIDYTEHFSLFRLASKVGYCTINNF